MTQDAAEGTAIGFRVVNGESVAGKVNEQRGSQETIVPWNQRRGLVSIMGGRPPPPKSLERPAHRR